MGYHEPKARDLLELVGRVSAYAGTATSTAEVLEFVVAEVARAAGFAVGHAYRLDGGAMVATGESWWVRESADTPRDITSLREMSESATFLAGVGLPGRALGRAEPTWYTDLTDSSVAGVLARREVALSCGLKSAFAFPTLAGRRVDAVLEFFADTPRRADPRLIEACTTIGQAIGQVFERIEAHQGQRAVQTHAQLILDNAGDAFVAIDGDGTVISWNRAAERMFGYEAVEAVGRFMPDLIMPPEYRAGHNAGIERYKAAGHGRVRDHYVELEAVRKDGEKFPVEMAFWGLKQQGRWQFYSFARDITERKAREADLVYRSVHDELTGLPNRSAAMEHITNALDFRNKNGGEIAVLVVDLDRFRITQERLGHGTVDALLVVVAERLRASVGDAGWLARVADDQFVIVCPQDSGASTAVDLAHRAQTAFGEPFQIKDDQVSIGASIGIVLASTDSDTADTILRDAGAGLSVDRESMRGAVKVFDRGGRSRIHRRLSTERDLADAIDGEQLRLHYQPVVDFADGRMVGVEALIRWQHPRRGLLAPGAFIDVAEESGLIVPIGNWVIAEACRQAAEWQRHGVERLSVAVNLSARQFTQSTLVSDIVRSVHDAALDLARSEMVFEVTESLLMNDPVEAATTLAALREGGFGISLDDFGTGYSSLAYLKSFAVDTIKIDRSFVMDIATDPRDRAIVAAVTRLGHALGLTVLAEGIETDAQRTCLIDLGCDLAQGYHFGRPMPAAEIMALVL
ncbi:MAG: EAL domain-containing protein [Nakamurella sp.]